MTSGASANDELRNCFREPIREIFEAAHLLDSAVSAHLRGDQNRADVLLRAADMPIIGEWLDSIWLGRSDYQLVRAVPNLPPVVPKPERYKPRDATNEMKKSLVGRDGHHCRLCGIPLVRAAVRKLLTQYYPDAARWKGIRESEQHRGLQVMWLQYDHVIVHSRGGETSLENIVVACPACNYGRDRFMMSEVSLRDPRTFPRSPTWDGWQSWDGLERLLPEKNRYLKLDVTQQSLPA
jgi:HNH endonuclease